MKFERGQDAVPRAACRPRANHADEYKQRSGEYIEARDNYIKASGSSKASKRRRVAERMDASDRCRFGSRSEGEKEGASRFPAKAKCARLNCAGRHRRLVIGVRMPAYFIGTSITSVKTRDDGAATSRSLDWPSIPKNVYHSS